MNEDLNEKDLDKKEVFRIHHNDIPKGQTQCRNHEWIIRNGELYCPVCQSGAIVNNIKDYDESN